MAFDSKPVDVSCPSCGGPMVRRKARSDGRTFWGCRKFPDCKGTLNTDGEAPRQYDRDSDDRGSLSPSERMRRNDRRRW